MSIDQKVLEQHIRDKKPLPEIEEIYRYIAKTNSREGTKICDKSRGYLTAIGFCKDGDYLYGATLNQKWILWYFRKPALEKGRIDEAETMMRFPHAIPKDRYGEIKLRIHDLKTAEKVLRFISVAQMR